MGFIENLAQGWRDRTGDDRANGPDTRRALTAAGAKVNLAQPSIAQTRREAWQSDSWGFRDTIPEMRFAGDFVASTLGRLRVFPAENRPRGEEPVPLERSSTRAQQADEVGVDQQTIDAAVAAVERLNLNQHGASLLSRLAENMEYAGECFLLGEHDDEAPGGSWSIRSISEVQLTQGGGRLVDPDSGMALRELKDSEVDLMRLWTPHPRFYDRPDAAVRSLLDVLEGMYLLGKRGRSHDRSRISAGKGLFIPQELLVMGSGGAPISADLPGSTDSPESSAMFERITEYMTAALSNEGDPSAVVPLVFIGPAQIGDTPTKDIIGTFDLHGEDPKNLDERYEALVMRFARGINLAPERIKGIGEATNTWCVDEETEALTSRGWLRHDELQVGDEVLTLNHETGLSEWQPVLDKFEKRVTDEPMLRMEGRWHSSLTTLNHRWPVLHKRGGKHYSTRVRAREWTTSDRLNTEDALVTAAPHRDVASEAKYTDAFVEVVAWFWTEGGYFSYQHRHRGVSISQSERANPEKVALIRRALTEVYGPAHDGDLPKKAGVPPMWRELRQAHECVIFRLNAAAAAPLHEVAPDKIVLREFIRDLTAGQLELFIHRSIQADGHYMGGVTPVIAQKRPETLEAFELACVLAGRSTNFYKDSYEARRVPNGPVHKRWVVSARARCTTQVIAANNERTVYTGVVWCPTTSNTSWFARRNGKTYYTGNSANTVTAEEVKVSVEPRAERLCDSLTAAYLQRMLRAMGVPLEQRRKVCLWFDPSELTQNPNRGQDAMNLFNAGELSGEATRRNNGFTEADAPSKEERLLRMLSHERLAPESVPAMIKVLGGQMPSISDIPSLAPTRPVVDASPNRLPTAPPRPPGSLSSRPGPPPKPDPTPPVGQRQAPTTAQQPGALGASAGRDQSGRFAGAESARQWRLDRRAGRKLVDIDRQLVDRLLALAESSVGRAVEKAANRIRSDALKTARGGEYRDALAASSFPKGSDPRAVVAAVGESMARVSDAAQLEALITAAIDDLEPQFLAEVERAAKATDAALDVMLADSAKAVTAAAPRSMLVEKVKRNAVAAWRWLSAKLREHARRVLYGGHTPSRGGEEDPSIVPASLVKGAVAMAGGLPERSAGVRDDGTSAGEPLGGVGTGDVALEKLRVSGGLVIAKEWVYPPVPRASFKPHVALDGTVFEEWTDPALKVGADDEWIAGGYYHPGDHGSCLCLVEPIAVVPMQESADPNGDEVASLRRKVLGR